MNILNRNTFVYGSFLLAVWVLLVGCADTPLDAPSPEPAGSTLPAATPTNEPDLITILAFGDSLTAGFGVDPTDSYPAQLEQKLIQDGYNVEVINGGISGETTTAALARLDWMLNTAPDMVIIETGGNDALRGVDIELTRQNFIEIVGRFSDSGTVVIVGGLQIVQNLGSEYATAFAAMYPEAAARHDAILIPFMLEGVAANPDLNQPDYIHPTAEGYAVIVDHIYPFVVEGIEEVGRKR